MAYDLHQSDMSIKIGTLKFSIKNKNTAMRHCSKLFFNQFSNDLLHIIPKSKLQLNIWDQLSLIG